MIAYVDNDNVVRLDGATAVNLSTGLHTYLDGTATVRFTITDLSNVPVPGETWPVPMTYIAASQGNFIGVVRRTVQLVANQDYKFIGEVTFGLDQYGKWTQPLAATERH